MQGTFIPALNKYYSKYHKLPVEATIKKYDEPFHWHDEIEIICVIRGRIEVQVNNKYHLLQEDEIIIINDEDVHRVTGHDDAVAYISLHIDMRYIEETMSNITYMYFSGDLFDNSTEKAIVLSRLRSKIANILLELKDKRKFYEDRILLEVNSLLNILIPESYKNIDQFERIYKIIDYIFANCTKKISIQDIAKHVYISESYVSHCIKANTDMSFEDLLNFARADLAIKKLLTTNLSITRISYECGFSDPKYFNKYFLKFFNCSPNEYRVKNNLQTAVSLSREVNDGIEYDDFLVGKLKRYVSEGNRVDVYGESVTRLDINLAGNFKSCRRLIHYWKEYLDVGDASLLLKDETQMLLRETQKDIGFSHIKIDNLFSRQLYAEGKVSLTDCYCDINKLLDFIYELNVGPMISLPYTNLPANLYQLLVENSFGDQLYPLASFARNCANRYEADFLNKFRFVNSGDFPAYPVHFLYDTFLVAPYFIGNILHPESDGFNKRFTALYDFAANGGFGGGLSLFTARGLKKSLYYAYCFLSCLGNTVVSEGECHIVTKRDEDIQILLYNPVEYLNKPELSDITGGDFSSLNRGNTLSFDININNLNGGNYIIKEFKLDREHGSVFENFRQFEVAEYLSPIDCITVNKASFPDVKVSLAAKCLHWNIKTVVAPGCVTLITFIPGNR